MAFLRTVSAECSRSPMTWELTVPTRSGVIRLVTAIRAPQDSRRLEEIRSR